MPTLDEVANDVEIETVESIVPGDEGIEEVQQNSSRFNELFSRLLTAETGDGAITDYIDHPMNFKKSEGLAQILRGLTGIVGNLKLAIIDVIFGALRFSNEGKGQNNNVRGDGGIYIP